MSTVAAPAETAVEDVWCSFGAPTNAADRPLGSERRSPDVAPYKRTGGLPHGQGVPGLTLVLNALNMQAIELSRLTQVLDELRRSGLNSLADIFRDFGRSRVSIGTIDNLRIELDSLGPLGHTESDLVAVEHVAHSTTVHGKLASELRELTGLPATSLAKALGVRREQYQRWLKDWPISDIRHGQLIYLHTIASDASRRLGSKEARVWWRTPAGNGQTPQSLLTQRRIDLIYRLVSELHDDQPEVDGTLMGLRVRHDADDDETPEGIEDQEDWSPYDPRSGS